jgi:3-oxoacyl-[acyl-carrier protein] reductase
MATLSGKVSLVTAASRGIGSAIAKHLARAGALVAINYAENTEAASSLVGEIKEAGGDAFAIQARVGSTAETQKLFTRLDDELSQRGRDGTLHILVNNAGLPHFGMVSTATEEDFNQVFEVNAKGTFLVTKAALPRLADGGRIINISSGASKRPGTLFGLYAMSKAVVDTMTISLAGELGPRRITANTVAPGWTVTEGNAKARENAATVQAVERQTAFGRLGTSDDIAAVVVLLASDESGWVTGQYIEASGGFKLI